MKILNIILISLLIISSQKGFSQKYIFNKRIEFLLYKSISGNEEQRKISEKNGVFKAEIVYSNQYRDTLFINTPDGTFITHHKHKSKEIEKNKIFEYWNAFSYTLGDRILIYIALDKSNMTFITDDKIITYLKK